MYYTVLYYQLHSHAAKQNYTFYERDYVQSVYYTGVYYQLHTDNQAVLDKASREVREFTEFKQYSASLVLVVTWDHVAHINSRNATVRSSCLARD